MREQSYKRSVKRLARAPLRALGYDIRRFDPRDDPERHFVWLQRQQIQTVVDVGANVGEFSTMIGKILPDSAIYAFEPLADCYQELVRALRRLPTTSVALNVALATHDGHANMRRSSYAPSSSLLQMADAHKQAFPHTAGETPERVRVTTLDGAIDELERDGYPVREHVLVKIDVQGSEDQVLAGGRRTLARTKIVIIETSFEELYTGQPLFSSIYDMLTSLGFVFRGNIAQLRNPEDGRFLQADSVFARGV